MQQLHGIDHYSHVPVPEDEIPALEIRQLRQHVDSLSHGFFLKIGIAWDDPSCCLKRGLQKTGAVKPGVRAAAPHIGRTDESFGDCDPIGLNVRKRA